MDLIEMMAGLDADALATLRTNADRLAEHASGKKQQAALSAIPLIAAEQARRAEAAPPKSTRKKPRAK